MPSCKCVAINPSVVTFSPIVHVYAIPEIGPACRRATARKLAPTGWAGVSKLRLKAPPYNRFVEIDRAIASASTTIT